MVDNAPRSKIGPEQVLNIIYFKGDCFVKTRQIDFNIGFVSWSNLFDY
jgi:hypothetical protein